MWADCSLTNKQLGHRRTPREGGPWARGSCWAAPWGQEVGCKNSAVLQTSLIKSLVLAGWNNKESRKTGEVKQLPASGMGGGGVNSWKYYCGHKANQTAVGTRTQDCVPALECQHSRPGGFSSLSGTGTPAGGRLVDFRQTDGRLYAKGRSWKDRRMSRFRRNWNATVSNAYVLL